MLKILLTISLTLLHLNAAAVRELDDVYLEKVFENWHSLSAPGAYDFMPEKVSYTLLNDPDFQQKLDEAGTKVNPGVEGQRMELVGFMVPLEIKGTDVLKFLLVPEAGQCVHVPPPPLNQTLLVDTTQNPIKLRDTYKPIIVSGEVRLDAQRFDLSNSQAPDANLDAGAAVFDNVESGYSLTGAVVDDLMFKDRFDD